MFSMCYYHRVKCSLCCYCSCLSEEEDSHDFNNKRYFQEYIPLAAFPSAITPPAPTPPTLMTHSVPYPNLPSTPLPTHRMKTNTTSSLAAHLCLIGLSVFPSLAAGQCWGRWYLHVNPHHRSHNNLTHTDTHTHARTGPQVTTSVQQGCWYWCKWSSRSQKQS